MSCRPSPLRSRCSSCRCTASSRRRRRARTATTQGFRFKSGVELINVTATVSDANGRFVPGLRQEDFVVYEDDAAGDASRTSAPSACRSASASRSTRAAAWPAARSRRRRRALDRLLYDLLDRQDEIFLYRFSNTPVLLQTWTRDRQQLSRALGRIAPNGGTAMYDAVAEAIPLTLQGQNRKKALLVISDGNDTSSATTVRELKAQIRESEALVYAIGIDGEGESTRRANRRRGRRFRRRRHGRFPAHPVRSAARRRSSRASRRPAAAAAAAGRAAANDDRVNVVALRDMTDDSGGRTEIIRDPRDLNPATASIADELSKQYYLGYPSSGKKDGRWHSIRVELRNRAYRVRARRGYVAS